MLIYGFPAGFTLYGGMYDSEDDRSALVVSLKRGGLGNNILRCDSVREHDKKGDTARVTVDARAIQQKPRHFVNKYRYRRLSLFNFRFYTLNDVLATRYSSNQFYF